MRMVVTILAEGSHPSAIVPKILNHGKVVRHLILRLTSLPNDESTADVNILTRAITEVIIRQNSCYV